MCKVTAMRDLIEACQLTIHVQDTLVGDLAMYSDLADSAVVAIAEMISGMMTSLVAQDADTELYDFGPEPRSYLEAKCGIGNFLAECARVIDGHNQDVSKIDFAEMEVRLTTYFALLKGR